MNAVRPTPSENRDAAELVWDDRRLEAPHLQDDKAARVRTMFDAIAATYERVNSVFSAGRDGYWRRRTVELAAVTADDRVLDLACGTGQMLRTFAASRPRPAMLVGCDFAHEMLRRAGADRSDGDLFWCEADALRLPFSDCAFTVVSCAFGVRNFQDLDAGLAEAARVLAPGGRIAILEFGRPSNPIVRSVYEFYTVRVMPTAATWLSRDRTGAYRYLPRSVISFPSVQEMTARLERVGFTPVSATPLTFGAVSVYIGIKV